MDGWCGIMSARQRMPLAANVACQERHRVVGVMMSVITNAVVVAGCSGCAYVLDQSKTDLETERRRKKKEKKSSVLAVRGIEPRPWKFQFHVLPLHQTTFHCTHTPTPPNVGWVVAAVGEEWR